MTQPMQASAISLKQHSAYRHDFTPNSEITYSCSLMLRVYMEETSNTYQYISPLIWHMLYLDLQLKIGFDWFRFVVFNATFLVFEDRLKTKLYNQRWFRFLICTRIWSIYLYISQLIRYSRCCVSISLAVTM